MDRRERGHGPQAGAGTHLGTCLALPDRKDPPPHDPGGEALTGDLTGFLRARPWLWERKLGPGPPPVLGTQDWGANSQQQSPIYMSFHLPLLWPVSTVILGDLTYPRTHLPIFKCFHEELTFCGQLIVSPEVNKQEQYLRFVISFLG